MMIVVTPLRRLAEVMLHADELSIALAMRRVSPEAFPNRRIVALADDILGRRGRMAQAVEAMGGNGFISEGVPFESPARH